MAGAWRPVRPEKFLMSFFLVPSKGFGRLRRISITSHRIVLA